MEYNTTREKLVLREYGRNFHKLIEHVKKIKEKEKRTDLSKLIVKLMNMAHPELKNQNEIEQKLWDDLHIMSNFELDVNSPYPIPEVDKLKGIERLEYPKNVIRFRHYGKKIELLIEEACKIKDSKEKESAIIHIGKIMKSFFGMWNKETIDNKVIIDNIKELSNGKLDIDIKKVEELNLFYKNTRERGSKSYQRKFSRPKTMKSFRRRRT
ncbi:MAG: hypothetical protein CL871_05090 [Cytophagia bacterium]|mgnify:FL=1|nr:hypothetical protein [Cytophagia bacterium]|tara:strand:- start:2589 stop:3221 length:633 start_codon:yes stop_codon:yes gene_type:complete